jgi:hypothetical protein
MKTLPIVAALVLAFSAGAAQAEKLKVRLSGYQEVPSSLSSAGAAEFEARIRRNHLGDVSIEWELSYNDGFTTPVQQAHIHFGQRHTNGGISVFLCTNLGNGPAGTQLCPPGPAKIEGTATAADVIGPAGQLIAAGEMEELLAAIRAGVAYVNIHTAQFPGGEVRGQFSRGHRH